MSDGTMILPPKMAAEFAERARNRDPAASYSAGGTCTFLQGRNQVTLVSLNPPAGHIRRLTDSEFRALKK